LAVKRSQSATRVLSVLEAVAARHPIGVSALAKLLDDDRCAVNRAVMTLADAGWIRPAHGAGSRWELSPRLFGIAHLPDNLNDLRARGRAVVDRVRDRTDETVFLAVPDVNRFLVIESAESPHALRMSSRVGQVFQSPDSATGRALLPYFDAERQAMILGRAPDAHDLAEFAATRARGYSLSAGDVMPGVTNLATAVFDTRAEPIACLVLSGPSDRVTPERHADLGALLAEGAAWLSRDGARASIVSEEGVRS
jgi:IclR family acetate operon transcriptional repressor